MEDNRIPIYDLKALSEVLKINIRTLRQYIKNGSLKAKKVGRTYYVTQPNLMVFLDPDSK